MRIFRWAAALVVATAIAAAGCATQPPASTPAGPVAAPGSAPAQARVAPDPFAAVPPPAIRDRLLALDPDHISSRDVRETLAKGPAPRIILLHGGVFPVYLLMKSFGVFLTRMGYPESRIRDPGNGGWSYSPYDDSAKLAGIVAWEYEHDGLRPMLIGHSQGGVQAVKVLDELAGNFAPSLRVFDPVTGEFEDRTTIVDPYTHHERPVVGLSVAYASVVGAGGLAFLMPNQWSMVDRLTTIPDTVDEFTGFSIDSDPVAMDYPGLDRPLPSQRHGEGAKRRASLPLQPHLRAGGRATRTRARGARLDRRLRPRRKARHLVAACRCPGPRPVGSRRLVQHQAPLVPGGATAGARLYRRPPWWGRIDPGGDAAAGAAGSIDRRGGHRREGARCTGCH